MLVKTLIIGLLASAVAVIATGKAATQLQVGVKYKPDECPLKTRKGDKLSMQ
jgi:FK506-binding protein 2